MHDGIADHYLLIMAQLFVWLVLRRRLCRETPADGSAARHPFFVEL